MDLWESQSNPALQSVAATGSAIVGVLLIMFAYPKIHGTGLTNEMAGFLLGVLLFAVGSVGILLSGRQTITIDPARRLITIDDEPYFFDSQKRVILFSDIVDIGLGYVGKPSNFVNFYCLRLKLKSGETFPLFSPGRFYEGSSSKYTVEGWRQRLNSYLE